jgi:DNA repair protein RadD
MITLRDYQQAAVEAVYDHLRTRDDNPCVVIPTAGGKTPVIATICRDAITLWGGRVLILAHVRELLEQAADKLRAICPGVSYGVYSAGLRRRDTEHPVIIAGIQSVYQRATELGAFDLVLVDEAHLIPADGEGMYRTFLAEARKINPNLRVIGFTATPYRLDCGYIYTPDGILNHVCYEVGVRELIVRGYLCQLISKGGKAKADISGLHVRGGEFVLGEVEALMDDDRLVEAACAEIVEQTRDRHAVLIFASGIKHGEHIVRVMREKHGVECGFVTGDTTSADRKETLSRFQSGQLKYLANVNVLTTGFDAPHIDCVVLLRPTLSPGLYYQMVGRGFRLHPGKQNCLVLDYGGNVLRHGPVDQIRVKTRTTSDVGEAPAKECPQCQSIIAAGYARCPDCGYEFPPPERNNHDAKASTAAVLSNQVTIEKYTVHDVYYGVHVKRVASEGAPKSLRVDYKIGWRRWKSEWICLEHTGYARQKAIAWWKQRSHHPVPATVDEAVAIARAGGLAPTLEITVRSVTGEEFDRIIDYKLGPIPEPANDKFLGDACPQCSSEHRLWVRGTGPHAAREECAKCGRFFRWVPESEVTKDKEYLIFDLKESQPKDSLDFPFGYNANATEDEIPW